MEIDGAQRAAAFAYYAFFSLFPLLLLFVTIGSLFFDRERAIQNVIDYTRTYFPLEPGMEQGVFDTIVGVIESRGNVGAAATIGLLWGSLQLFKALVRATSRAWRSDMHNWWQMPLKALSLLGVLASALILGLVVPVGAKLAQDWLPPMYGLVSWLTSLAIAIVPTLVLFYGLTLFYRLAPRRTTRFSEVWFAAAVAAISLRALEWMFFFYLTNFGRFNVVYGTFGGIMALLMWIYLSGCIVVYGACLCAAWCEVRDSGKVA